MGCKTKLQTRRIVREDGGDVWLVERLSKPHTVGDGDIRTDARVIRTSPGGLRSVRGLRYKYTSYRCDLELHRLPWATGGRAYFHRVVAFAWRGPTYQDVGGVEVDFPGGSENYTWAAFEASGLQVDHGPKGPGRVLVGDLTICTRARNAELERQRAAPPTPGGARRRKRAALPAVEDRFQKRKAAKREEEEKKKKEAA
jgi:hypothetical protein